MNLDSFVSIVSRGLQRGFRCLISGREFLESEQVTRAEAERLCREHVASVIYSQDGELYGPGQLRPDRTAEDRRRQYAAQQSNPVPGPLPFVPGK